MGGGSPNFHIVTTILLYLWSSKNVWEFHLPISHQQSMFQWTLTECLIIQFHFDFLSGVGVRSQREGHCPIRLLPAHCKHQSLIVHWQLYFWQLLVTQAPSALFSNWINLLRWSTKFRETSLLTNYKEYRKRQGRTATAMESAMYGTEGTQTKSSLVTTSQPLHMWAIASSLVSGEAIVEASLAKHAWFHYCSSVIKLTLTPFFSLVVREEDLKLKPSPWCDLLTTSSHPEAI